MLTLFKTGAAVAAVSVIALPATADEKQAAIDDAVSAAPPQIADNAKIMTMEGQVLREGDGAYTCLPGVEGGPGPMCLDSEWTRLIDALVHKKEFQPQAVGLAYMLAGDMPGGGASNIDPFATEPTSDNQWVVEGPHVMVILPDPAALDQLTTDPNSGGPYVMWKGTPYAHIMVPVAPRPE